MDVLYYVDEYNPKWVNPAVPNNYVASISFTDDSPEKSLCKSPLALKQGSFPVAVSLLNNQTVRSYLYVSKRNTSTLYDLDNILKSRYHNNTGYEARSAQTAMTNADSMIGTFAW